MSSLQQLKDPLCSTKVMKKYLNTVFANSYKGMCTTIVGFPGAGKTLEIAYFCKNARLLPGYKSHHLFSIIDIGLLDTDPSSAFQDTIVFLLSNFSDEFSDEFQSLINSTLSLPQIKLADFLKLIYTGVSLGYNFTFIVDSANRLLFPGKNVSSIIGILSSIRKIHTAQISFVFLALREFDETSIENLGSLGSLFVQNFVYGKDLLFDEEGMEYLYTYHELNSKVKFSSKLRNKLNILCYGDPRIFHIFINKIKANQSLEEKLLSCASVEAVVSLIGNVTLKDHYKKVLQVLLPTTLSYVLRTTPEDVRLPDYLKLSGLYIKDISTNKYKPLNPLFQFFIDFYEIATAENAISSDKQYVKTQINGQQILIFNLLEDALGNVVSRESIAKLLWGDDWEAKYSDWAIDQAIARLRSKLEDMRFNKSIKTVKGKGFMLV